jgi:histidine triad (HIT) family protein
VTTCPFCEIAANDLDGELVAYRTENVFVITALRQRANHYGHALVLPNEHVVDLSGAPSSLLAEVFEVVARVSAAMARAFGAVGTTVMQNNSIPDQTLLHLHVHVVPRFVGDGFRLPDPTISVIDHETRVSQAAELARALHAPDSAPSTQRRPRFD